MLHNNLFMTSFPGVDVGVVVGSVLVLGDRGYRGGLTVSQQLLAMMKVIVKKVGRKVKT